MEKNDIGEYYKLFVQCLNSDDWEIVNYQTVKIQKLKCEIVHFFNKKMASGSQNLTFFMADSVVIGYGGEYMAGVSLFGEDYK